MSRLLCIAALLLVATGSSFAQTVTPPVTQPVTLAWLEATPSVTFNIYRWDKSQVTGFTKINATPVTTLTYTDTTAVVGTMYAYKVSAVNSAGESAQSAEADITVSVPVTIPGVPTGLKVTVVITN